MPITRCYILPVCVSRLIQTHLGYHLRYFVGFKIGNENYEDSYTNTSMKILRMEVES